MSTTTITITMAITNTHHMPMRIGSVQDSSVLDDTRDEPSSWRARFLPWGGGNSCTRRGVTASGPQILRGFPGTPGHTP